MKMDCLLSQLTMNGNTESAMVHDCRSSAEHFYSAEEIPSSEFMQVFTAVMHCLQLQEAVPPDYPTTDFPPATDYLFSLKQESDNSQLKNFIPVAHVFHDQVDQSPANFSPVWDMDTNDSPSGLQYSALFPDSFNNNGSRDPAFNLQFSMPYTKPESAVMSQAQKPPLETVLLKTTNHAESIPGKIAYTIKNGASELEIQLYPPTMGKLKIQLSTEHNRLSLRIMVDTVQAKELIDQNLFQLRAELTDSGFEIDSLDIDLSDNYVSHDHPDQPELSSAENKPQILEAEQADSLILLPKAGIEFLPSFKRIDCFV